MLLVTLALVSSTFAQAVTLSHFIIHRDGGGQLEAVVSESDEGLRINLKSCHFRTMPEGLEAPVQGQRTMLETKLILRGKASILSDMSPATQIGETGSWTRLTYVIASQTQGFEVRHPMIMINGALSSVLDNLENQARELCK